MKMKQVKQRRMLIMEQISQRQHSRERSRRTSADRRRKLQENLNGFVKTMSQMPYNRTGDSQIFRFNQNQSKQSFYPQPSSDIRQIQTEQQQIVARSPSFKDIHFQNQSKIEQIDQQQNYPIKQNQQYFKQDISESLNNIQEEEIKLQDQDIKIYPFLNVQHNDKSLLSNNPIIQNESVSSAVLFTSQFNYFINKKHLQNQQMQNDTLNKQINKDKVQQEKDQQNNNITENISPNQQYNINDIVSERLKLENAHIDRQINHFPNTIQMENRQTKILIKNKSGHSLALSNQSSLKYSLYESNLKQVFNYRVINDVSLDTNHFQAQDNQSNIYPILKIKIIADKVILKEWRSFHKDFNLFSKIYIFSLKVIKRQKRTYFEAFIINQQLNFQQKKNQIKCDKFFMDKQQDRLRGIFDFLKRNYFTIPLQNRQKSDKLFEKTNKNLKQKVFIHLKISWFDQKVKKQIELYYLSKIFSHFARVVKAQKTIARNKSLFHYCHNLKKRFFKLLVQEIDKMQTQRIKKDNADWHYLFRLQKKVFNAWRQRLSYKDKYISLAMTTKNTFKQTGDKKWLQIKTVDFRQIK